MENNYSKEEFEQWIDIREEAYRWARQKEESVIRSWLNKIGYIDPVGYYRDSYNKTMEIYAERVGILIGKEGSGADELKQLVEDEFGGKWQIKFIEIRGGFVNI